MTTKAQYEKELNKDLVIVMQELGLPKIRIMLVMAMLTACNLKETMMDWVCTFYGKEDTLTALTFMSKVDELTAPYTTKEY